MFRKKDLRGQISWREDGFVAWSSYRENIFLAMGGLIQGLIPVILADPGWDSALLRL
jgi:hypothetical protein